ncbi:MAG: Ig-like domain repeat protein [Candidatus Bathyarchaeia archaeon]|jgi:ABC-type transporter MlaC component
MSKHRGISTYIAVLILIIIAIIAGLLIYAYTMGYIGGFNVGAGGNELQIESTSQTNGQLLLYVKNIGQNSLKLNPATPSNARVYVDDVSVLYQIKELEYANLLPSGSTCTIGILVSQTWVGNTVQVKVVADDGTFVVTTVKINVPDGISHTITASAGPNGQISPSGTVFVADGASVTFTITPNTQDFYISMVTVDTQSVGAVTSYTFNSVTGDHSISATFAGGPSFIITSSVSSGGTISPLGQVMVPYGGSQTFTIQANPGWYLSDVLINGTVHVGAIGSYTFTGVEANGITIAATFIQGVAHTITSSANTGGSITPLGTVTVPDGGSQAFTITADSSHYIANVMVDGVSVGAIGSYTFTNVITDHIIVVTFATGSAYLITSSAGAGGSISPLGSVYVVAGGSISFTIAPNTGYHIVDVVVDTYSYGAINSYTFSNINGIHTIAASFALNTYTITVTAGLHGAITPGTSQVSYGSSKVFTITADSGYYVADVKVDGVSIGAVMSYTFTNIVSDHTLSATFAFGHAYTITSTAGAGGSISPLGPVAVPDGSSVTFTIKPNSGYHIADVKVDTVSVGLVNVYTFTNVAADHTIDASFTGTTITHTITSSVDANGGGTINPLGKVTIPDGGSQSYVIQASGGYHVSDVKVDGVSVGAVMTYTFSNVISDHVIVASFAVGIAHTITSSAGVGGTIAPLGPVAVVDGGSQTFTMTANSGYHIVDVLVDGVSVGAVGTYGFTGVTKDHTISVVFSTFTFTISASVGSGRGSISPSGDVDVAYGGTQTFTITPSTSGGGNHVSDVLVDGVSVGPVLSYTFTNVQADHTIVASFSSGASHTITSSAGPGGIIFPAGSISVGNLQSQTFTITPNTGYSIAAVMVDGVSKGTVNTYTFSSVTSDHTISVTFMLNTVTITASAGLNGAISPSGSVIVPYGSSQTFTITASTGYHVQDVLVDGQTVGPVMSYTFYNIIIPHTIAASFASGTAHTITSSAGPGGKIFPLGPVAVIDGGSQTFTITPNAYYQIQDVKVDGASVGAVTSYPFTAVTKDHTISVTFIPVASLTITATAGPNGSINPSGAVQVSYGGSQTFTMTPNNNFHVQDVQVDGVSVGALASYTFSNVVASHTISVTFTTGAQHVITATAGSGGTISPSGQVVVADGGSQTFTITANGGYKITDVLVDKVSVGAVGTYPFTGVTADHTIEASFAVVTSYTITASADTNGSINPSGAVSVNVGASQPFAISANSGYYILDVKVDGSSVGAVGSYTFTNVQADHIIVVTTASGHAYTITSSSTAGGSISPLGPVSVPDGKSQTFTLTPSTGYRISDVKVDQVSVGTPSTYTFSNVIANHRIDAYFAIQQFIITASAGANGQISPLGQTTVNYGGSQSYTITANSGYHVSDVLVDGKSVGAVESYSFSNVVVAHTIAASFASGVAHTITASAGTGGTIAPVGPVSVIDAGSQSFTITASAGYKIADVLVDGASVGAVSTYQFTDVVADHTIQASFAADTYTLTVNVSGSGSVTILPKQTSYAYGAQVQLTAIPANGVTFTSWTGGGLTGNTNPITVTINSNTVITATFSNAQATSMGWYSWSPTTVIGQSYQSIGILTASGNGVLNGKLIRIQLTRPDGTQVVSTTTTALLGLFYVNAVPDAVGTWTVYCQFLGDSTYGASVLGPRTFTVTKMGSTTTCSVSPPAATLGQPITVSGSVTPASGSDISGQTVTFTFTAPGGSTFTGTATTDSSGDYTYQFTPNVSGAWTVVASFAGDPSHNPSTSSSQAFTVKASATVAAPSFTPSSPITVGTQETLTATVTGSSGTPTGTVTFQYSTNGGTSWSNVGSAVTLNGGSASTTYNPGAGSYVFRATYNGDSTYNSATSVASSTLVVNKNTISVPAPTFSPASPIALGQSVTLSVTIPGTPTPTGTVQFQYSLNGGTWTNTGSTVTLSSGTATRTFTASSTGSYVFRVTYNGDSNYNSATGATSSTLVVGKANPTVPAPTFSPSSPIAVGTTETIRVTISGGSGTPTGTVTFQYSTDSGSTWTNLGSAVNLSGSGQASTTYTPAAGSYIFHAIYSGDTNYNGATGAASSTLVVNPPTLTNFTFSSTSSKTAGTAFSETITAKDQNGNTLTSYTGTVHFTSTDPQATLPPDYTFTTADAGAHTFTSGFTLRTAGSQRITVTDAAAKVSTQSSSITVNAASATKLVYTAGASQTIAHNVKSSVITAQLQDAYGNAVTASSTVTVNFSTTSSGGYFTSTSGSSTHITSKTITSGNDSVNFYYTDANTGSPTITASSSGLTSAQTTFTIT